MPRTLRCILFVAILLTGCTRSISSTVLPTAGDAADLPSAEPASSTPAAGAADPDVISSPIAPPTATPSWAGTPDPRFADTSLVEVGYIDVGILIVVLDLKSDLPGEYQAIVGADTYTCTRLDPYPQRLYCSGPAPSASTIVPFTLYPAPSGAPLIQLSIPVPEQSSL